MSAYTPRPASATHYTHAGYNANTNALGLYLGQESNARDVRPAHHPRTIPHHTYTTHQYHHNTYPSFPQQTPPYSSSSSSYSYTPSQSTSYTQSSIPFPKPPSNGNSYAPRVPHLPTSAMHHPTLPTPQLPSNTSAYAAAAQGGWEDDENEEDEEERVRRYIPRPPNAPRMRTIPLPDVESVVYAPHPGDSRRREL